MQTTQNTRRKQFFFSTNKNGQKCAYRWDGRQLRAFRYDLAEAELLLATEQADRLDGHPLKREG